MAPRFWVVLALAACSKKDAPAPAPKAAEPTKIDPWGDPPATKIAAGTGTKLAQIETKAPAPSAKVDPWAVEAPAAPKVELKGLGSAQTTGFTVTYNPSKVAGHEQMRAALAEHHVFETVAQGLNNTVRVPKVVPIQLVDCNTINAFYDPNNHRIIVCYELLDYFTQVFKPTAKNDDELGNAVIGATLFSFYHETGHGLIHLLDLPAVGREEDSVDQLATLTLISMGDEGVAMAESGAYWFQLQAQHGQHDTPFWDEHGFDGQRFYNIMCLIYGSNPDKYAKFVSSGTLPKERAARCPEEYAKIDKAWEKLLSPYVTNAAAVNIDYKPQVAVAEAPRTTAKDPWGDSPSGDSTPTVNSPPPEAKPTGHAITCEQVADKAAALIRSEAEARAGTLTDADRAQIDARLPAAMHQILAQCAKEDWPDPARKCVLDADTLAKASSCK
jgi:hypothetical protein